MAEGTLKLFTGCDMLHFNPKYKDPFSARATARIIIATNVRPPFRDRSDGDSVAIGSIAVSSHDPRGEAKQKSGR